MPYATGRPLKLISRIDVADENGDPIRMTVGDAICREIEATGLKPASCASAGGVASEQVTRWMSEANKLADVAARRPDDYPWTRREKVLLAFRQSAQAAKSRWIKERVELHRQVAKGDVVVGDVTEKVDPTRTDPNTGQPVVLERTVKRRRTLPDARAIEWELAHLAKDEGFGDALELSGPGGGPIEVDDGSSKARDLLADLDAYEAGMADRADADADLAARPEGGTKWIS